MSAMKSGPQRNVTQMLSHDITEGEMAGRVVISLEPRFALILAGYLNRAAEPHGGVLQELAQLIERSPLREIA